MFLDYYLQLQGFEKQIIIDKIPSKDYVQLTIIQFKPNLIMKLVKFFCNLTQLFSFIAYMPRIVIVHNFDNEDLLNFM